MMDIWLNRNTGLGDRIAMPNASLRRTPQFPIDFLRSFRQGMMATLQRRWRRDVGNPCMTHGRPSENVRRSIDDVTTFDSDTWSSRWQEQVDSFFDVTTSIIHVGQMDDDSLAKLISGQDDFGKAWPNAAAIRRLASTQTDTDTGFSGVPAQVIGR